MNSIKHIPQISKKFNFLINGKLLLKIRLEGILFIQEPLPQRHRVIKKYNGTTNNKKHNIILENKTITTQLKFNIIERIIILIKKSIYITKNKTDIKISLWKRKTKS